MTGGGWSRCSTRPLASTQRLTITVAEGVETAAHLQALGEYGCDEVQGFYVSHPVEADEVVAWLRARPSRT